MNSVSAFVTAWRTPAHRFTWIALSAMSVIVSVQAAGSQCYGTVSNGRIEDSVKLPARGKNFTAYSTVATAAGRTYVHSKVADTVLAAYSALQASKPSVTYMYGETGWRSGGRFRPHRTHQNGLSVDFFVPVSNALGQSARLPTQLSNRYGYDIEFDAQGKYGEYTIDFPALSEHLYQLDRAAKAHGIGISLVIFEKPYLKQLFATPRGPYLQKNMPFMKGKPWVRHDEHYHVNFSVPCKPLTGK